MPSGVAEPELSPNFVLSAEACAGLVCDMSQTPSFEITYHLRTGNDGQQRAIIQATSLDTARRIFAQQNPQCVIDSARPLPSGR